MYTRCDATTVASGVDTYLSPRSKSIEVNTSHWSQTQFLEGHRALHSLAPTLIKHTWSSKPRSSGSLETSKQVWVGAGWSYTVQSCGPPGIEFETTDISSLPRWAFLCKHLVWSAHYQTQPTLGVVLIGSFIYIPFPVVCPYFCNSYT